MGEEVSSYWISLSKLEGTVNWEKKHCIALYVERALEEAMILSWLRLCDADDDDDDDM